MFNIRRTLRTFSQTGISIGLCTAAHVERSHCKNGRKTAQRATVYSRGFNELWRPSRLSKDVPWSLTHCAPRTEEALTVTSDFARPRWSVWKKRRYTNIRTAWPYTLWIVSNINPKVVVPQPVPQRRLFCPYKSSTSSAVLSPFSYFHSTSCHKSTKSCSSHKKEISWKRLQRLNLEFPGINVQWWYSHFTIGYRSSTRCSCYHWPLSLI